MRVNFIPSESLLLSYIRGLESADQNTQIEIWMFQNQENENLVLAIAQIYLAQEASDIINNTKSIDAYSKIQRKIKQRKIRRFIRNYSSAAAFILGLVLASAIFLLLQVKPASDLQYTTVESNPGMRTSFYLPDGTQVYLNSASSISYNSNYNDKNRSLNLNGEAYFKVKPNNKKPFIVSVFDQDMRIRVLGTEFNLRAYSKSKEIQTSLVSGKVQVLIRSPKGKENISDLMPSEKAIYKPNTGQLSIVKTNTNHETAWMEGKLIFKDLEMEQVLEKLSNFYDVDFNIIDKEIKTYRFTGTFQNRQLVQILEYLKMSSKIEYVISHAPTDDSKEPRKTLVTLKKSLPII